MSKVERAAADEPPWDVAVVGAGPAGLMAAYRAAQAGARTVVLERAVHPRYKTCGGGLIGVSRRLAEPLSVPLATLTRDEIRAVTFTHNGDRPVNRRATTPLLTLVRREEFDDALRVAAQAAGAVIRQRSTVRSLDQNADAARVRLADGSTVTAAVVIGADGSAGVTGRAVGVHCDQVDLGLEVELPVGDELRARWRGRVLLDWGPLPGSYAWVFPKDDRLTVGVIAARGQGAATRAYLVNVLARLGLSGVKPAEDSGHLTRCRSPRSPLRAGRVIVAGDAAGLLEPWTREGISFALRSGSFAGEVAARAVHAGDPTLLGGYEEDVSRHLVPEMTAGARLLAAFTRRPGLVHAAISTRWGWRAFARICRGDVSIADVWGHRAVRLAVAAATRP